MAKGYCTGQHMYTVYILYNVHKNKVPLIFITTIRKSVETDHLGPAHQYFPQISYLVLEEVVFYIGLKS